VDSVLAAGFIRLDYKPQKLLSLERISSTAQRVHLDQLLKPLQQLLLSAGIP
jgi:hypothetical protein